MRPRLPAWLVAEVRPVLAVAGAGASLVSGSVVLAARGWAWLSERLSLGERLAALAAGGYLAVYGCAHAPHTARFAVPGAVVAWCVAAWWVAPNTVDEEEGEPAEDEPSEPDPQDVADLVRDLIGDDRGVLLTALRAPFHAADTRAVRELLAGASIAVRPGVRTAAGNGPGVHRDDLPAAPPPPVAPSAEVVAAGEDANTNTNNKLRVHSREGMTIINDPADRHRTHSLKKP
ncbi:hypothetical protein [Streptomyces sp. NPDC001315]|uniref:hypothetical protein n=1 Tax=Streptomyces sp. NPDC001315 TaxID=3364562 RepID=UPI0036CB060F